MTQSIAGRVESWTRRQAEQLGFRDLKDLLGLGGSSTGASSGSGGGGAHAATHHSAGSDPLTGQSIAGLLSTSTPTFAGLALNGLITWTANSGLLMNAVANLDLRSNANVKVVIDDDNNDTTRTFQIRKDGVSGTLLFGFAENNDFYPGTDSTGGVGSNTNYFATAYIDRYYLNATAYLDGANAGRIGITGTLDSFTMTEANNIALGTTTGTKIGTAITQKLGFYNATPIVQGASVADPSGGTTVDSQARTAIIAVISRLEALGLIATV